LSHEKGIHYKILKKTKLRYCQRFDAFEFSLRFFRFFVRDLSVFRLEFNIRKNMRSSFSCKAIFRSLILNSFKIFRSTLICWRNLSLNGFISDYIKKLWNYEKKERKIIGFLSNQTLCSLFFFTNIRFNVKTKLKLK
jgi:hypothetical protein